MLEISSTPYIFTFKLWDWGRLGLDGKPRPINIEHGRNVIQWDRTTQWTKKNLINRVRKLAEGNGWVEEATGLHEREFIETGRHWFTGKVIHHTNGGVNVLYLVEGREAIVESPSGAFEPFVVHFAETFIVPACVGEYTIRPYGESEGQQCATSKPMSEPVSILIPFCMKSKRSSGTFSTNFMSFYVMGFVDLVWCCHGNMSTGFGLSDSVVSSRPVLFLYGLLCFPYLRAFFRIGKGKSLP